MGPEKNIARITVPLAPRAVQLAVERERGALVVALASVSRSQHARSHTSLTILAADDNPFRTKGRHAEGLTTQYPTAQRTVQVSVQPSKRLIHIDKMGPTLPGRVWLHNPSLPLTMREQSAK